MASCCPCIFLLIVGICALPPVPDIREKVSEKRSERDIHKRDVSFQNAPINLSARHKASNPLNPRGNPPTGSTVDNTTNTQTGIFSASDFEYRQQIFQPDLENNNPENSENEHFESQTPKSHDETGPNTYYYNRRRYSSLPGSNGQPTRRPTTQYSENRVGYGDADSNERYLYTAGGPGHGQNYGSIPYIRGQRQTTSYSGANTGTGYRTQYGSSQDGIYPLPAGNQVGSFLRQTSDYSHYYMSNDQDCPTSEARVYINGMSCTAAVNTLGSFVCYNYERVSQECCQTCLPLKRPSSPGCEYGDKSFQCRNIEPFDCYVDRNRDICCDRCTQFQRQQTGARHGCEYGDLTPRCQLIRQRPHLCYLGENQRLCCITCPHLADKLQPDCKWGNQNPDLCQPFDSNRRLRINCYQSAVREVCCATCKSLRERITQNIAGCEYGDSPVQFSTGRGILDCGSYLREYGIENCNNADVAKHCCYSCFRYRYGA